LAKLKDVRRTRGVPAFAGASLKAQIQLKSFDFS
jgi:hypothetical protein